MVDRLDELQRLHDAATKGPWRADVTPSGPSGQVLRNEAVVADHASRDIVLVARRGSERGHQWAKDATCIAAMRNALPALLRVARAAQKSIGGDTFTTDDLRTHFPDAYELHAALAELRGTDG